MCERKREEFRWFDKTDYISFRSSRSNQKYQQFIQYEEGLRQSGEIDRQNGFKVLSIAWACKKAQA
jgi:hypothetical protein